MVGTMRASFAQISVRKDTILNKLHGAVCVTYNMATNRVHFLRYGFRTKSARQDGSMGASTTNRIFRNNRFTYAANFFFKMNAIIFKTYLDNVQATLNNKYILTISAGERDGRD